MRIVKFLPILFFSPRNGGIVIPDLPRYLIVLPSVFLYVHFVIATLVTLTHIFLFSLIKDVGRFVYGLTLGMCTSLTRSLRCKKVIV